MLVPPILASVLCLYYMLYLSQSLYYFTWSPCWNCINSSNLKITFIHNLPCRKLFLLTCLMFSCSKWVYMYLFTKKTSSLVYLFAFTSSSNYSIKSTIIRCTCIQLSRIKGTSQYPCRQDIHWNRRSFIIWNTWLSICDVIMKSLKIPNSPEKVEKRGQCSTLVIWTWSTIYNVC